MHAGKVTGEPTGYDDEIGRRRSGCIVVTISACIHIIRCSIGLPFGTMLRKASEIVRGEEFPGDVRDGDRSS